MSFEVLSLDLDGHLAVITLRRPEVLNALSRELTAEVHAALDEVAGVDDVRVLILTGEGRGFCSGADVTEWREAQLGRDDRSEPFERKSGIVQLASHLRSIPQPVIAAVNGTAAGAGLGLALTSDIRIASEQAKFSSIFVKRSLVPDTASSYTLPMLVGHGIAAEMALTGNIYDAHWALSVGLVNRVVPADHLMNTAISLGKIIAGNPPLTVRSIKQLLSSSYENIDAILSREGAANAPSEGSEDKVEAVRAFLEKRPPVFWGR